MFQILNLKIRCTVAKVNFVAWSCNWLILNCLGCCSSLSLAHSPSRFHFLYFHHFSIFFFPFSCRKGQRQCPKGEQSMFVHVCVCETAFKRWWICRSVWERKIVRRGDEKGIVDPLVCACVLVRVLPFLRLANWDIGPVCALHQPFWYKSHMSIAVNLDNGIKLVELFWDSGLQCVHACIHTLKATYTSRGWCGLIYVGKTHMCIYAVAEALPVTVAKTDLCGT